MIKAFGATDTVYTTLGDKILTPSKCTMHIEKNGDYYLSITDRIEMQEYYAAGRIIAVMTPESSSYQAFRCDSPERTQTKITVKAWHVYYDRENYILQDSRVEGLTANAAMQHFNEGTVDLSPFTVSSDIPDTTAFIYEIRKSLTDADDRCIEEYGGWLKRDNWSVALDTTSGADNGAEYRPSKNIKTIDIQEDWNEVVTKIEPVGTNGQLLDDPWMVSETQYDRPYTKVISFSQDISQDDFETEEEYIAALKDDLASQANDYLAKHCVPAVSYTVGVHIDGADRLGDTVRVYDSVVGVDILTQVIGYDWNCITQTMESVTFGSYGQKLSGLIQTVTAAASEETQIIVTGAQAELTEKIAAAADSIIGMMGQSYVQYDGSRILVLSALPASSAQNQILINSGGILFSNDYGATFTSCWTIAGTFDAQAINVANFAADYIKGGTLSLGKYNGSDGLINIYSARGSLITKLDKTGMYCYATNGSYVSLTPDHGFVGYDADGNPAYWASADEFHMVKGVVDTNLTLMGKIKAVPVSNNDTEGVAFVSIL